MTVGIISLTDPAKGLWRDTEILIWALQAPNLRRISSIPKSVSVFTVTRFSPEINKSPQKLTACSPKQSLSNAVRAGTKFNDWISNLKVMICNEVWLEKPFQLAKEKDVRVIYVPNLDCATTFGGTSAWINAVKRSDIEVWAKTSYCYRVLREAGIKSTLVPWTIPDIVRRDRSSSMEKPINFLFIAGRGGIKNRRALDLALKAYALARKQDQNITLTIHSVKPLKKYVSNDLLNVEGINISEGFLARQHLKKFHDQADVLLYPTRWDGFGLSLLEALHEGLPVLSSDGQPMNELVEHEHNGLLIDANKVGLTHLTPHFECSINALANAMIRVSTDDILRDRLTCPEPSTWIARQHNFCLRVQQLAYEETVPKVAIFMRKTTSQGARRSEKYWRDALRSYGYNAFLYSFEDVTENLKECLSGEFEFILVSKVSPDFIKQIRLYNSAPIILWHHDISDHSKNRWRWFRNVASMCNLVAVPESGRKLFKDLPENIIQVFPGAKIDGDRGPGRRPRRELGKGKQDTIVFLGKITRQRSHLVEALAERFKVFVYGDNHNIAIKNVEIQPSVWGKNAVSVIRNSMMVLSTSMRNDYFYTSNRLFNSAGAGGCVLVKSFPNLWKLYPSNCIIEFNGSSDIIRKANKLAGDKLLQLQLCMEAENHTWRYHTWIDRIGEILRIVKKLKQNNLPLNSRNYPSNNTTRYWNNRALNLGNRASGYFKWSNRQLYEITVKLWSKLSWHLIKHLNHMDNNLLDFGCGTGRFLERLKKLGVNVFGAEISPAMLDLTKRNCKSKLGHLVQIETDKGLPFRDDSFNVLWCCTVMQHVPDVLFDNLIGELHRILVPNALILLFENTHKHTERTSDSGHVVFREAYEYMTAFPGISVVDSINIEGEVHNILVGRLNKSARLANKSINSGLKTPLRLNQKAISLHKKPKSKIKLISLPSESQTIHVDETIPRLTPAHEVRFLCWLTKQIKGNIVEIGCNKGLTTRDLAISNPEKIIYTVDYFNTDGGMSNMQKHESPSLKDFCLYARDLWNVVCIYKNSAEINYESLSNVKLIFIDGDHTFDAVKADTERALNFLYSNSGGLIVWHDYYEGAPKWVGVMKFVNSLGIEVDHIKGTRLAVTKITSNNNQLF